MKLVQKLTMKTMGWPRNEIENALAEVPKNGEVLMGRVVGIATGLRRTLDEKTGEIQVGLKGQFRGVSAKTGEEVTSGVCYMPSGIQAMIEGELAKAQDEANGGNANATIRFALDLFCLNDTNKAGYTFRAENLMTVEAGDPLNDLLEAAAGVAPLSLPAPAKAGK